MIRLIPLIALIVATLAGAAPVTAQTPASAAPQRSETPPAPASKPTPLDIQQLPWPIRLGLRSHVVTQNFPLIDRVVLVPDAATYLDELSKWSPQGRWPVLIEDDHYAPMFVRRFKPRQLLRRASVGTLPDDVGAQQKLVENLIVRTLGGDPAQHTMRELFARHQYVPPGVVIASMKDSAWTAAAALAAGRVQPIAWLDEPLGLPNEELDHESAMRIAETIRTLVAQQGYSYQTLGDEIDTITICRSMAVRAAVTLPAAARISVTGVDTSGPIAMTDLLGRNGDGSRYALTGWIFGDEIRSAYVAMCSLFLPRERVWYYNTYPLDGGWAGYAMGAAAAAIAKRGYVTQHFVGESANEVAWRRSLMGGLSTDVMIMNSKGGADIFDLSSGLAYAIDVPVLNTPVVLHLTHSWSMQAPTNVNSIGGRWLERGAYAAVGSCWEPYLSAFTPPAVLSERFMNYIPLLVAARWWDGQGPFSKPWRVITYGDPLMLIAPPDEATKSRIDPPPLDPASGAIDLNEHVKDLMRQTQTDPTGESFGQAIAVLSMLGQDDIARELWRMADAKGKGHHAATAVMPVLFRLRDADEFINAWQQSPHRDAQAYDMLWHLLEPRLGGLADQQLLMPLQYAIRPMVEPIDLKRLAPHLTRVFGRNHVREVINRTLSHMSPGEERQRVAELLKQF